MQAASSAEPNSGLMSITGHEFGSPRLKSSRNPLARSSTSAVLGNCSRRSNRPTARSASPALHAVQNAPADSPQLWTLRRTGPCRCSAFTGRTLWGELEWLSWIGALAAFHDARVVRLFASLITTESHTELLFALANYLRAESFTPSESELSAALMQDGCVARARAVASVLATMPSVVGRVRLCESGCLQPGDSTPLPLFSAAPANG